jgi:hypothetical protein
MVDGEPIWLSHRLVELLCALVRGRLAGTPVIGEAKSMKLNISRLRQTIDAALGAGRGEELIVHIGKGTYALAAPPENIVMDPSFRTYPLPEPLAAIRDAICLFLPAKKRRSKHE